MFGFTGAHRTGKTTLARATAEATGLYFFETRVGARMKEAGFDMVSAMPLQTRILAQMKLLEFYLDDLDKIPRPFITDRTPIDFIAYLLAEVGMHSGMSDEDDASINAFIGLCLDATRAHFHSLFVIGILSTFDVAEGKPPKNISYQRHVQALIESFASDAGVHGLGFIPEMPIAERTYSCTQFVTGRLTELAQERKNLLLH